MRVSIHFTPKGQNVQELIKKTKDAITVLKATGEPLHIYHAFLTEKHCKQLGLPLDIVKMFDSFVDEYTSVHAFDGEEYNATKARLEVFRAITLCDFDDLARVSLFIGEIKEGVLDEYVSLDNYKSVRKVHIQ